MDRRVSIVRVRRGASIMGGDGLASWTTGTDRAVGGLSPRGACGFERGSERWLRSVEQPTDLDEARPVRWGDVWPLRQIVAYTATHWAYHAGEINVILANRRREAWEYDEHVEENHILTIGHSVRRPWVTDEQVERAEKEMRRAATGSVPGK
jgi:hypothetical protein